MGGTDGEEEWWAEGYRFAWGRLWDTRAQELGDSPEALAVHSVADCTSKRWGGTLGKLWKFAMGSPGKGKGEVLSRFLLRQSRGGASASSMRGTIAAVRIAEDTGWIPPTVALIHRRLAKSGGGGTRIPILPFPSGSAGSSEKGMGGTGWEAHGGAHVRIVVHFPPCR